MNQLPIAPIITEYHKISIVSLMAYPKPATNRALRLYSKPLKLGFKYIFRVVTQVIIIMIIRSKRPMYRGINLKGDKTGSVAFKLTE